MSQLYISFENLEIGERPPETTLRRSAVEGHFTKQLDGTEDVLRYFAGAGGTAARGLAFNKAEIFGESEILFCLRDANTSSPLSARGLIFAIDDPDSEFGVIFGNEFFTLEIYRRSLGTFSSINSASPVSFDSSKYFYVRFKVIQGSPNLLKAKAWGEHDIEPNWQLEGFFTASLPSVSVRWNGVLGFAQDVSIFYKFVSFGWDGDSAPLIRPQEMQVFNPSWWLQSAATNIPTLSAPGVIDITATSARPQVTLTY
jgi:hypothetical protein